MKTSRLQLSLALAGALTFASCEMFEGTTADGVVTTLNTVAQVATIASQLTSDGGDSDELMKKISDNSLKAGNLQATLKAALDTLSPEYKATLEPVLAGLKALTGKDEKQLKQLDPAHRKQASKQFSLDAATLVPIVNAAIEKLQAPKTDQ